MNKNDGVTRRYSEGFKLKISMDGICIESHQFNRYWPLGNEISNPEEIARGAKWLIQELEHGN